MGFNIRQTQQDQFVITVNGKVMEFLGNPDSFRPEFGTPSVQEGRAFFGQTIENTPYSTDYSSSGFSVEIMNSRQSPYTLLDLDSELRKSMGRATVDASFSSVNSAFQSFTIKDGTASLSANGSDSATITIKGNFDNLVR